jgi:ABC-type multidrug transport system permease subunit
MFTSIFITVVQQIMPLFVTQRALYEVRERPSKAYSWVAFLIANMLVEIPYQIICGILMWATYYYPIVGVQSSERQILTLLLSILFFVYAATFAHMCIAAVPDAQTAGAFVTFGFAMTLIFNGVMQAPDALPGFWIFMHRVSHLTYFVASFASTALHGKPINCSNAEASIFQPPSNQTCGQYLQQFLTNAPGVLRNPDATSDCNYCQLAVADTFLAGFDIEWRHRWRDFAFMFAYIGFNMAMTVFLYWFFRVRTSNKKTKSQTVAKPSSTAPPSPPNEAAASHEKELEH